MGVKTWSPEQEEYLKLHYANTPTCNIANFLGKTHASVSSRATILKLLKAPGFHGKKTWLVDDDEYLKTHYPNGDLPALCAFLKVSMTALYGRAMVLGVKRSEIMINKSMLDNRENLLEAGKKSRFKKGVCAFNKGKRQTDFMRPDAIHRTVATRFKTGIVPINRVPLGTERVTSGYVYIKVADGRKNKNWRQKSHVVYEKHFGSVPAGFIIEHIDGNTLNFEPGNLNLTTRKANAEKNRLKDTAILKRYFNVTQHDDVCFWVKNHYDLIEMKRNEMRLNGAIHRAKKNRVK